MTGDCHVPFRGSPGVKFPWATRLWTLRITTLLCEGWPPAPAAGALSTPVWPSGCTST
jgi:hypothetical protein